MSEKPRPTQVFLSYAHADHLHLDQFRNHFGPVERGKNLVVWYDRNLSGGQVWNDEIRRAINASDIFVCLVTSNFLQSSYIRDTELPAIWQAVRGRGALLVTIVVEKSFWEAEFGSIQCLPKDKKGSLKPAADWRPKRDGFHSAAEQAAFAIDSWLKELPPPPQDPGPGLTLQVTELGFDLAPDVPSIAERGDPLQRRLLDSLRSVWSSLLTDAARSCANSHPTLVRSLEEYGKLIGTDLSDIDVVGLAVTGSALGGLVEALRPPIAVGMMTDPLEPELAAGFTTLLREHGRFVLGFAEGREIVARDSLHKALIDDPSVSKRALHEALTPMVEEPGLLTARARDVLRQVDATLIETGVRSTEAVASAIRHGGRAIAAIARAIATKIKSPFDAMTLAGFAAILNGDPNFETYRAAFHFLTENAQQISALASTQPELRRIIDWIMEKAGSRELPASSGESGRASIDRAPSERPSDFDYDRVVELLLDGKLPPRNWIPWITELDFAGCALRDLAPISALTALKQLDISRTQVANLEPLGRLTSLSVLVMWGVKVSDIGPLRGLKSLIELDISYTLVSDIEPLRSLDSLRKIDLSNTPIVDIEPLRKLTSLVQVSISGTSIPDILPLRELFRLEVLNIAHTSIVILDPVIYLENLNDLNASHSSVNDISPLRFLKSIEFLNLTGTSISDLSPLSHISSLSTLNISNTLVTELKPIDKFKSLVSLDISFTKISDLGPLVGLKSLVKIDATKTLVTDVAPLRGLLNLRSIDISKTDIVDLRPLSRLTGLRCLYLEGMKWLDEKQLTSFMIPLDELVVFNTPTNLDRQIAKYQIDPDGTVHDPDGEASFQFEYFAAQATKERKKSAT